METLEPGGAGRNPVSGVGVLDRSMALLGLLADGPRTLRSLAQASGLPRPTELALRAGHGLELGTVAAGVLARLHDQTLESVQLYLRSGDRRLCVAAQDAGAGLRDSVPVGALLPLDA